MRTKIKHLRPSEKSAVEPSFLTADFAEYAERKAGTGETHQLLGDQMDSLIDELNGALVA